VLVDYSGCCGDWACGFITEAGLDERRLNRLTGTADRRRQERSTSLAVGFDPYSAGTQFCPSMAGRS
jgi:hypothetical protein